jgi:signal transduction histidine kinase
MAFPHPSLKFQDRNGNAELTKFCSASKGKYLKPGNNISFSRAGYLEHLTEIQEEEKRKLGQELHDSINISLTIGKYYLGTIKPKNQKESFAIEQLSTILNSTDESIRSISGELVASQRKGQGLISMVDDLLQKVKTLNQFSISFEHCNGAYLDKLLEKHTMLLYRIVQEQLNNILKHSKATAVNICLDIQSGDICLIVNDNGIGFREDQTATGIGLSNIKNRVANFGGTTRLTSSSGEGCSVSIRIPLYGL